jgi:16S rRNA (cytosine967-C5)-methyltransferase
MTSPRQVAFQVLRDLDRRDTYPDLALDRALQKTALSPQDRGLATELVYGVLRRQRTLDALISQFSQRPSAQQPPALRRLLQLGLYQLRYLDQVPPSAAVNTSVDLAKENGLEGLSKVVNGILRAYLRQTEGGQDPLILPEDPTRRLGVGESFPDWIVDLFLKEWGEDRAQALCQAFNQTPLLDLRINPLKTSRGAVQTQFAEAGIDSHPLPGLPQALRLPGRGSIRQLPGFQEGLWTVQSAPAQ